MLQAGEYAYAYSPGVQYRIDGDGPHAGHEGTVTAVTPVPETPWQWVAVRCDCGGVFTFEERQP